MRGSTFFTLLTGAAIGVCITMFLNSERGHEMRERVGDWLEDEGEMIKDKYQRMRRTGGELMDDMKQGYKKAKSGVEQEIEKVKEGFATE